MYPNGPQQRQAVPGGVLLYPVRKSVNLSWNLSTTRGVRAHWVKLKYDFLRVWIVPGCSECLAVALGKFQLKGTIAIRCGPLLLNRIPQASWESPEQGEETEGRCSAKMKCTLYLKISSDFCISASHLFSYSSNRMAASFPEIPNAMVFKSLLWQL